MYSSSRSLGLFTNPNAASPQRSPWSTMPTWSSARSPMLFQSRFQQSLWNPQPEPEPAKPTGSVLLNTAKQAIVMAGLPEPQSNEELIHGVVQVVGKLKSLYDTAIAQRKQSQMQLVQQAKTMGGSSSSAPSNQDGGQASSDAQDAIDASDLLTPQPAMHVSQPQPVVQANQKLGATPASSSALMTPQKQALLALAQQFAQKAAQNAQGSPQANQILSLISSLQQQQLTPQQTQEKLQEIKDSNPMTAMLSNTAMKSIASTIVPNLQTPSRDYNKQILDTLKSTWNVSQQ